MVLLLSVYPATGSAPQELSLGAAGGHSPDMAKPLKASLPKLFLHWHHPCSLQDVTKAMHLKRLKLTNVMLGLSLFLSLSLSHTHTHTHTQTFTTKNHHTVEVAKRAHMCLCTPVSRQVDLEVVIVAGRCCIPHRLTLMLFLAFAPCVLTFAPFTFDRCNRSTYTGGGCHQLELVLVVLFLQPLAQTVHLHKW